MRVGGGPALRGASDAPGLLIHHNGVMSNMTEKLRPTYDLKAVKEAFSTEEGLSITTTALRNAAALGLLKADIVAVIQSMTRSQFVKSVTSYGNHRSGRMSIMSRSTQASFM